MCSGTYYLIIGAVRLPTLNSQAARYNLISLFPLPHKHVWTLSYTYRVLISPIDESSEQRNNKTKPKHNNFPCCEQWLLHGVALLLYGVALLLYGVALCKLCHGEPEDGQILHSAMPRSGMPRHVRVLRCGVGSYVALAQIFMISPIFPLIQPKTKENSYTF